VQRLRPAHGRQAASVPGALHLAWPLIRRFTERVFAEDRMAVEAEVRRAGLQAKWPQAGTTGGYRAWRT